MNSTQEKKIAVLIPCYNEALTIKQVIVDFKNQLPHAKIYVYDNDSSDNTFQIAQSEKVVVKKEFNRGKGYVIRRMFNDIEADIYIMIDGDNTYSIKDIQNLLNTFEEKNADMVVGDRLKNNSYFLENKRLFHGFGNILVRESINILFNANLNDIMSGYRVFSKKFIKSYPVLHKGFEIETDMTIFALHNKLNIEEVEITFKNRPKGSQSKLNTFIDGFKVLRTIFNMFRFYKPFKFFGNLALLFLISGIGIGIPVIQEFIQYQYVYKVPSAILAVGLVLFSLLLFICGLILDTIANNERKHFEFYFKNLDFISSTLYNKTKN